MTSTQTPKKQSVDLVDCLKLYTSQVSQWVCRYCRYILYDLCFDKHKSKAISIPIYTFTSPNLGEGLIDLSQAIVFRIRSFG